MQHTTETGMLYAAQHLDQLSHILSANSDLVQHNTKLSHRKNQFSCT